MVIYNVGERANAKYSLKRIFSNSSFEKQDFSHGKGCRSHPWKLFTLYASNKEGSCYLHREEVIKYMLYVFYKNHL
jgi:hypothetical protein